MKAFFSKPINIVIAIVLAFGLTIIAIEVVKALTVTTVVAATSVSGAKYGAGLSDTAIYGSDIALVRDSNYVFLFTVYGSGDVQPLYQIKHAGVYGDTMEMALRVRTAKGYLGVFTKKADSLMGHWFPDSVRAVAGFATAIEYEKSGTTDWYIRPLWKSYRGGPYLSGTAKIDRVTQ